jgi:formylmethanofuran dehydrogenase subunit E
MGFMEEMVEYQGNSHNAIYEKMSIKRVRASTGLHELKEGVIRCLRCDEKFKSSDVRSNRLCEDCKCKDDYDLQEHEVGSIY